MRYLLDIRTWAGIFLGGGIASILANQFAETALILGSWSILLGLGLLGLSDIIRWRREWRAEAGEGEREPR